MVFPTYPSALLPPAAYNWSGHYIGAVVGHGWGNTSVGEISFFDDPLDIDPVGGLPGFGFGTSGKLGGVEIGTGWQSGALYFGVEADIAATNISGTHADDVAGFSVDSTLNWLSTARLRGGVPVDRFLLFASGGLALGGVTADLHDTYPGPVVIDTSSSATSWGWTAGGGVAAALGDHWVIKAEYLYVDLGSQQHSFSEPSPPGWPLITTSGKMTASIGRIGLDYRF